MKAVFISNNSIGSGLSGGDNIWIELLRGWSRHMDVVLVGSEEAADMARRKGVSGFRFVQSDTANTSENAYTVMGMIRHHLRRIRKGLGVLDEEAEVFDGVDVVYSASDAYADFLPAMRLKRQKPDIKWLAGYYLFIPPPWAADTPYRGKNTLRGFLYWFMQLYSYRKVRRLADNVLVTSEPDVSKFVTASRPRDRVTIVRGGVDVAAADKWLTNSGTDLVSRKYAACYIGRLHYQKGVMELVEIWSRVVEKKPDAKLAIIGDGQLDRELKVLIEKRGLAGNIDMLGFLDGERKFEVFRNSMLVVHPATYDSGGMAAAEAMAWRLPGVSFDLEALKTYYPKGMLKTPCGDNDAFAINILRLLNDKALYEKMAVEAFDLVREQWDWRKRSEEVYQEVFG